ncbi:putative Nitrate/sulfonate/bicarbonate ABC transporter periplasmic protein [Microbacterium sp. C448]|uniref:hypothetical protein n=1 Tax=Microbacterium TaxID=33882 RepID=UPI0003DE6AF7|nr:MULTISPECIES: hypothetical protein [Microbacterium]CDK00547.1 putative Nitrate/sulfonate/bicarbonate ABC transporter periplasmic protein [Microbacterium sp. C448]
MYRRTVRTFLVGAGIAAAVLLAGCTAAGSSDPSVSGANPSASDSSTEPGAGSASPSTSAGSDAAPAAPSIELTCDNTMSPDALARYQAAGWTGQVRDQTWLIAGEPVTDGILCQWMEDHSVATDNFTWLGWAPVADAEATISDLILEGGWRREDAAEGIYITADDAQMMPIVDAEGYGTTYLFVDGQVRYASTKSELGSITAPPGFTP